MTQKYTLNAIDHNMNNSVNWSHDIQFAEGALQCILLGDDLNMRKDSLKTEVFAHVTKKVKEKDGYSYFFENSQLEIRDALDFILYEMQCCPFFKFDVSILPFNQGFGIKISGSPAAIEMLEDFEEWE